LKEVALKQRQKSGAKFKNVLKSLKVTTNSIFKRVFSKIFQSLQTRKSSKQKRGNL